MQTRDFIYLTVNGQLQKISGQHVFLPITDYLRYELGLTGTKVVCAEGDCGACTIMLRRCQQTSESFKSINSCISASMLLDGCHLITIEGLANSGELSEVQQSMVRNFGAQCGFCTPGFVMSITNMYEQSPDNISDQKIKNYLTGNLCRCTGYYPIINAARDVDRKNLKPLNESIDQSTLDRELLKEVSRPVLIRWNKMEFFAPVNLQQAVEYKISHPDVRIFSGATDLGVQFNKGKKLGHSFMSLHLLEELYELVENDEWIQVGARVNIGQLQKFLENRSPDFSNFLNIFASPQIKNVATLVGNVANGSPIADTIPYLLTTDAKVILFGSSGNREVLLENFITGYKTFDIKPDEIITHIYFKILPKKAKVGLYKISQRRDLDISCVNSSFVVETDGEKIKKARFAIGGVGPTTLRLKQAEKKMEGNILSAQLIEDTKKIILSDIFPISDSRGTQLYRSHICLDLFSKFVKEHFQ